MESTMTWNLTDPCMNYMHRVGVAALARTCHLMLRRKLLPEGSVSINEMELSLHGDIPKMLSHIYDFGFQLRDGIIFLPAMFGEDAIDQFNNPIVYEIHTRLLASIFMGDTPYLVEYKKEIKKAGKKGGKDKEQTIKRQVTDEYEDKSIVIEASEIDFFKAHNKSRPSKFFNKKGKLVAAVEIKKPNMMCATVTHQLLGSKSTIKTSAPLAIALDFVPAGILPIGWRDGEKSRGSIQYYTTILYPEVDDLKKYCDRRPEMNPDGYVDLIANNPMEVAVKILLNNKLNGSPFRKFHALTMTSLAWSKKQKACCSISEIDLDDFTPMIDQLDNVFELFHSKCVESSKNGGGTYLIPSPFRKLFVDNITSSKPWFQGFNRLVGNYEEQFQYIRNDVKEALAAMINSAENFDDERAVIDAIHFYKWHVRRKIQNELWGGPGEMPKAVSSLVWTKVDKAIEKDIHELRRLRKPEEIRRFIVRLLTDCTTNRAVNGNVDSFLRVFNSKDADYMRDIALLGLSSSFMNAIDSAKQTALADA